ncbi:MAG: YMGG-like glycine zipper-containing protein, partial [Ferruginibacter sp.]
AAMATMVVSCKNKTKEETKVLSATEQADSIEFAKFKEQKAKNEAVAAYKASHPVVATAPATTTAAPKKKGWSKAAKGAVIGAGTGAVAGAIINKRNRAAGAVIGGVVGGGVGYGVGRSMDKKDGRN